MKVLVTIAVATAMAAFVGCSGDGDVSKASGNFQETIPSSPTEDVPAAGDEDFDGGSNANFVNCSANGEDFSICVEASEEIYNQYGAFCEAFEGSKGSSKCTSKGSKSCQIKGATVYVGGEAAEYSCAELELIVNAAISGLHD